MRSDVKRDLAVGGLAFVLGVLLTLMLHEPPKVEPPACPEAPACPTCGPACPAPVVAAPHAPPPRAARSRPSARPDTTVPLPPLDVDPEAHRDRLRAWFEQKGTTLVSCFQKGEPRRRLLVEMKIEADGSVAEVTLLGADELAADSARCVQSRVKALRVPKAELRGRETLVVYVNL